MPAGDGWLYAAQALNPVVMAIADKMHQGKARSANEEWMKKYGIGGIGGAGTGDKAATAAPPPTTSGNPMAASEDAAQSGSIYDLPPDQRDTVINGIPPASIAKNPMAKREREGIEGMPMGPPTKQAAPPSASTPQGGFNAAAAPPPTSGGGLTAEAMYDLQTRMGNLKYGQQYVDAAMMRYKMQKEAEQRAYEEQKAREKRAYEQQQDRVDFAQDMYLSDRRDRGMQVNPEAAPYRGQIYDQIQQGSYTGTVTAPGDMLPEGAAGPTRDAREIPLFEPIAETPEYYITKTPVKNDGTQDIVMVDKSNGQSHVAYTSSGHHVPGSSRGGSSGGGYAAPPGSGEWAQYEKDPNWNKLHNLRSQFGTYLDSLMYARRSFGNDGGGDEYMSGEGGNEGVKLPMPAGDGKKTVQRTFRSDQDVVNEIHRIRREFEKVRNELRDKYGWEPEQPLGWEPEL